MEHRDGHVIPDGSIHVRECRELMDGCRSSIDRQFAEVYDAIKSEVSIVHKRVDETEKNYKQVLLLIIGNLIVGITTLAGVLITVVFG